MQILKQNWHFSRSIKFYLIELCEFECHTCGALTKWTEILTNLIVDLELHNKRYRSLKIESTI